MKTAFLFVDGNPSQAELLARLKKDNESLPEAVFHEKAFQALFQIALMGRDQNGTDFYIESEEGKMQPDSAIGAIELRYDYNLVADDPKDPVEYDPVKFHEDVMMALERPYSFEHYPSCGYIDCIRVKIKVASDTVIEHTYWPSMHHYCETESANLRWSENGKPFFTGE